MATKKIYATDFADSHRFIPKQTLSNHYNLWQLKNLDADFADFADSRGFIQNKILYRTYNLRQILKKTF